MKTVNVITFFLSLLVLSSCSKQDVQPEERKLNLKKVSSLQLGTNNVDSIAQLVSEFGLVNLSSNIPDNSFAVQFETVSAARDFIIKMKESSVVIANGNTANTTTTNKFNTLITGPQSDKVTDVVTSSNLVGENSFFVELPYMMLRSPRFQLNFPAGFLLQGVLEGDQTYKVGSSRWNFVRFDFQRLSVDLTGFSFLSSYENKGVTLTQTGSGSNAARFSFDGLYSIVVLIKDLGVLYKFPIRGLGLVEFGPYLNYGDWWGIGRIAQQDIKLRQFKIY